MLTKCSLSVLHQGFTGRRKGVRQSVLPPPPERTRDYSLNSVLFFSSEWTLLLLNEARIRKGKMKVNPPGGHRTGNATIKVEMLMFITIISVHQLMKQF